MDNSSKIVTVATDINSETSSNIKSKKRKPPPPLNIITKEESKPVEKEKPKKPTEILNRNLMLLEGPMHTSGLRLHGLLRPTRQTNSNQ